MDKKIQREDPPCANSDHSSIHHPSSKYQISVDSDKHHNDQNTTCSKCQESTPPVQLPHHTTTRRPVQTTRKQFSFACVVFLTVGMTNFYGYSATLNASHAIQRYLYPDNETLADTLTAVFMSFDFLVTAILSFFGALQQGLITVGLAMMSLGSLGMLLTCEFIRGSAGSALLHIFCAIIGSGSSISCSATFTLASRLRDPVYPATVSTGGGATGVVSFAVWMLLTQGVFTYDEQGVRHSLFVLFGLGIAMPILAFVLYTTFVRLDFVQNYLATEPDKNMPPSNCVCRHAEAKFVEVLARSGSKSISAALEIEPAAPTTNYDPELFQRESDETNSESNLENREAIVAVNADKSLSVDKAKGSSNETIASLKARSNELLRRHSGSGNATKVSLKQRGIDWWRVLSHCYPATLFSFIACFSTYLLFPVVGPLHWNVNSTQNDVITGVFQFGDMTGRYLPILGSYIPFLRPKLRGAFIFIICRLVFIATFILSQRLPSTPVFGDLWFQIIQTLLLSMSMGFVTTLMMVRAPTFLDDDDKLGRSKASSLGVFGILLGISAGQWTSNLLIL